MKKPRSRNRMKIAVAIDDFELTAGHANTDSTRFTV